MEPATRSKLCAAALLALCVLLPAGCGGSDEADFTNENFGDLVADVAGNDGASVDVVGEVALVERDDEGVYLYLFAHPQDQTWPVVVVVDDPELQVAEEARVRVTGTVRNDLELPVSMSGFTDEPVVLASTVAPVRSAG